MDSEKVIITYDHLLTLIAKIQLMNKQELWELAIRASRLEDDETLEWIRHIHEGDI